MTVRTPHARWTFERSTTETDLAAYDVLPRLVATLLHGRGIEATDAAAFLSDRTQPLGDPFLLAGMEAAVARLRSAYERGEKVCVYGDYDADGLTAQALIVTALRAWDFRDVCTYTPHRDKEGYGLHHGALAQLAEEGVQMVIAVDLGISNAAEVAGIGERGVDVIVVDHHTIPVTIPAAAAVINPHLPESAYPFRSLAGVGVAYALVRALAASGAPFGRPEPGVLTTLLSFVAIGTVADVVPLVGENRILVRAGLRALRKTDHAGLRALFERAGIRQSDLEASHISFALAPRLNAPGRVRGVEDSYRLLMPESAVEARMAAVALDEANRTRQAETHRVIAEAIARIEAEGLAERDRVLFVGDPSWGIGIVGLVAAKLADRYHRPAFVYARGQTTSRGSARSIAAFDLIEALQVHADLMVHHGGHPRAAGFTVENDKIAALHAALIAHAEHLTDEDLSPTLRLDAILTHDEVSLAAHDQIATLAPFGHMNPEPLFLLPGVRVREIRSVGADGAHMAFQAVLDSGETVRCIAFGLGPRERELGQLAAVDLAVTVQRDVWRGDERLQLRVRDFRPAD
jgi:single-stranded-DNA-specific exonuclease